MKYVVTAPIWLGDVVWNVGTILTLRDGFKLYDENGKWLNKNYISKNIKLID